MLIEKAAEVGIFFVHLQYINVGELLKAEKSFACVVHPVLLFYFSILMYNI